MIDLRSDTVTKPTPAMRKAMAEVCLPFELPQERQMSMLLQQAESA